MPSTEEDEQATAHQKFMDETTEDEEVEMEHKNGKKDQLTEVSLNLKTEFELTQKELGAALENNEKLQPGCVDKVSVTRIASQTASQRSSLPRQP